ncbi:hypothetical protein DAPPUDRAFT_98702 [Daphnia pulex]|uniref:Uncharacterized protein n=1 Tax=Daphnia pulex TaxID=6669 RepID=E9G5K4_DAPPU|nr:hypothetical protein DAPPUDRAFT_98702 [Daphnia pulex]|eukprot:EFX85614.1 hypothetical protein DAPPUDRAFT_98702 [Daphnia pulex]
MASFYRWLSFIAESTTVAPMSHGYGGYQTATSVPNYTTYATTGYYTEAHKYYSTPIPATIPMLQLISPLSPTSTAPPRHRNSTPHPTPLQLLHRRSKTLHHQRTGVLRDYVCYPSLLPQLSTPAYYTEAPKYSSAPASTPTLQNTTPPENRSTTRLRMLPQLTTPAFYTSLLHLGSQICRSYLKTFKLLVTGNRC